MSRERRGTSDGNGGWNGGGIDGAGLRVASVETRDRGWRATVEVATDSGWFAGHFPRQPILPAVAQIDLVARLAQRWLGEATDSGRVVGLDSLRLSAQVEPGATLTVDLVAPDDVTARFRLATADGRRVSDGVLRWTSTPEATPASASGAVHSVDDALPEAATHDPPATVHREAAFDPAAALIHTPPALLAEAILEVTADSVLCRGRIPAESPSVHAGQAGPWMALELAAQAAGLLEPAHRAHEAGAPAAPRIGYLVRIRNARFAAPSLTAEAPLLARVTQEGRGGPLTLYAVTVATPAGQPLATAHLGTFLPPT